MASGIAHRDWQIARSDYTNDFGGVDEAAFRAAVQNELALAEHIGERLGVAIIAAPRRRRFGDLWVTEGWRFQTASIPADPAPGEVVAVDGDPVELDADALSAAA